MSYLAMTAASIDSDNTQNYNNYNNDTLINKKRQNNSHNKTQKRITSESFDSQKVNNVLESIHNRLPDDDQDNLGSYNPKGTPVTSKHSENFKPLNPFNPPENPISMGTERTKLRPEGMSNMDENLVPKPADDNSLDMQELQNNFMNDAEVKNYFKKLVPDYKQRNDNNKNYYVNANSNTQKMNTNDSSNQVLIEKLNYMINLLEEQQDQKTSNVTEEVVLYSFLGIFIIFVVDSFARVGKYVR